MKAMEQRYPRLHTTWQKRGVPAAGGVPDERGADMVLEALAAAALHVARASVQQFAFEELRRLVAPFRDEAGEGAEPSSDAGEAQQVASARYAALDGLQVLLHAMQTHPAQLDLQAAALGLLRGCALGRGSALLGETLRGFDAGCAPPQPFFHPAPRLALSRPWATGLLDAPSCSSLRLQRPDFGRRRLMRALPGLGRMGWGRRRGVGVLLDALRGCTRDASAESDGLACLASLVGGGAEGMRQVAQGGGAPPATHMTVCAPCGRW